MLYRIIELMINNRFHFIQCFLFLKIGPGQQGHMMQQMPMNAPPHHLQQNGPSHMGSAPNHMHPSMGPHGMNSKFIKQIMK